MIPAAYWTFGLLWGLWVVLLPDATRTAGLSSGPLGATLTAGFVLGIPAMLLAGRRIGPSGTGRTMSVAAVVMAGSIAAFALQPSAWAFALATVALMTASGVFDVAINAAALGRPATAASVGMTLLHAGFSFGGACGAFGAALLLALGAPYQAVYLVVPMPLVLLAVAAWFSHPPVPHGRGDGAAPARARRTVLLALLPFAALAGMAFLNEGALETWSSFLLRESAAAGAVIGAVGVGVFHAAMTVSRLAGGAMLRLGRPADVLAGASVVAAAAMAIALAIPSPAVVIPGLAVTAVGTALAAPVALSLAGATGLPSGRVSSLVLTVAYGGFVVGPILIGGIAELASLRVALVVVPLTSVAIAVTALAVGRGD